MPYAYANIAFAQAAALGSCRALSGWEIAVEDEAGRLWVRRNLALGDKLAEQRWRSLPFDERYEEGDAGFLFLPGARVARRFLPELPWLALDSWLRVARPVPLSSGARPIPLALRPVRMERAEAEASAMLVPADLWCEWACSAPALRLRPLRFALSSDHRICVRGLPLPSLPGEGLVISAGVALPAGWSFPAHVRPSWLARLAGLADAEDLAIWHEDGAMEILRAAAFLPVTRANVRASCDPAFQAISTPADLL